MNGFPDQRKGGPQRLISIELDAKSIRRTNPNIDHEREVAIYDILDANSFALEGRDDGPYKLTLGIVEDRLVLFYSVGNREAFDIARSTMFTRAVTNWQALPDHPAGAEY